MKRILCSVLLFAAIAANAQQPLILRQYMFNKSYLNPAFAGSDEDVSVAVVYGHQWAGFAGAPRNIFGRVDGTVAKGNVALGLNIANEQLGIHNNTDITAQFAYRILFKNDRRLVFGVQGSVGVFRENGTALNTTYTGDDQYKQDLSLVNFNAGAGVAYYSKNVWVGFSVPQLLRNRTNYVAGDNKVRAARFNFNIAAGYNLRIKNFGISPSLVIHHSGNVKFRMDINLNLKYKEIFWVGPFYRVNTSYGLLIGVSPVKWMKIGYAGEVAQQIQLLKNNYGTHEVMLGFNITPKKSKVSQSPRNF